MGLFEKIAVADLKFRVIAVTFVLGWIATTGLGVTLLGASALGMSAAAGVVVAGVLAYAVANRIGAIPSEYPDEMPGRRGEN